MLVTGLYQDSLNENNDHAMLCSHYWLVATAYKFAPDTPINIGFLNSIWSSVPTWVLFRRQKSPQEPPRHRLSQFSITKPLRSSIKPILKEQEDPTFFFSFLAHFKWDNEYNWWGGGNICGLRQNISTNIFAWYLDDYSVRRYVQYNTERYRSKSNIKSSKAIY